MMRTKEKMIPLAEERNDAQGSEAKETTDEKQPNDQVSEGFSLARRGGGWAESRALLDLN
jgi:hypothetical protein